MPERNRRILPHIPVPVVQRIVSLVPGLVMLLALVWVVHDLPMGERLVLLRYLMMAFAAFMAFLTPHMLFPEPEKTLMMQLNLSPRYLFLHQTERLKALWGFAVAAAFVVAFVDLHHPEVAFDERTRLFATGVLGMSAIMAYALYRYVTIGERSQRWSEGSGGLAVVRQQAGRDAALYPSFLSTIMVTVAGMMAVVISAAIPWASLQWVPLLGLLGLAVWRLSQMMPVYDRHFYQCDAFFSELFTNPATGRQEAREPARYESIYWVPERWRAAVWTQIVQMDRKRPMGRLVILLTATWWALLWLQAPPALVTGWLVFWVLAKNMLSWPSANRRLSPPLFHWWMLPPRDWAVVRFFLQVRWTLALFLTVAVAAVFSGSVGWGQLAFWVSVDLVASAASAWVLTRQNEYAFLRRFV